MLIGLVVLIQGLMLRLVISRKRGRQISTFTTVQTMSLSVMWRCLKMWLKKFAALFEATREYCRELPISTMKAHVPWAKFRNKILLFETKDSYVENGGHRSPLECL